MRSLEGKRRVPQATDAGQAHARAIEEIGAGAEIDITASENLDDPLTAGLDVASHGLGCEITTARTTQHREAWEIHNVVTTRVVTREASQRRVLVERDDITPRRNDRDRLRRGMLEVKSDIADIVGRVDADRLGREGGHAGNVAAGGIETERIGVELVHGNRSMEGCFRSDRAGRPAVCASLTKHKIDRRPRRTRKVANEGKILRAGRLLDAAGSARSRENPRIGIGKIEACRGPCRRCDGRTSRRDGNCPGLAQTR